MALPADFNGRHGLVLMRRNNTTMEWFAVRFLNYGVDVIIDQPGAGSFQYEIWAMAGSTSGITTVTVYANSEHSIAVMQAKR